MAASSARLFQPPKEASLPVPKEFKTTEVQDCQDFYFIGKTDKFRQDLLLPQAREWITGVLGEDVTIAEKESKDEILIIGSNKANQAVAIKCHINHFTHASRPKPVSAFATMQKFLDRGGLEGGFEWISLNVAATNREKIEEQAYLESMMRLTEANKFKYFASPELHDALKAVLETSAKKLEKPDEKPRRMLNLS